MLRLGITMRVVQADGYLEPRDALAQNWGHLMSDLLPEACWMPLPNIGSGLIHLMQVWNLNGFVLSGGENVGESRLRDLTESTILDYALDHRYPVLGVCRGLQFLQHYFGGSLETAAGHVAHDHLIHFADHPAYAGLAGEYAVNSYHANVIRTLAPPLQELARAEDGTIEAACSPENRLLGVQWHPERRVGGHLKDRFLLRRLFYNEENARA